MKTLFDTYLEFLKQDKETMEAIKEEALKAYSDATMPIEAIIEDLLYGEVIQLLK